MTTRATISPEPVAAAEVYSTAVLAQAPRLVSLLDRAPHSPSYGSFDRDHWSWKFRDFPLGMSQTAVYPLALLWKHPWHGSPFYRSKVLLEWIQRGIEESLKRQHSNGAFDAFGPNEREAGTTLAVMHGLCEAFRLIRTDLPGDWASRFIEAAQRAFRFSLQHPEIETHAFVSNHWGLFAIAFLDAHEILGDTAYRQRADEIVTKILRAQYPEGCYSEYGGADPGYETLGIHHLALFWQRTRQAAVLESLRRSIEFHSHWVHPDGSIGGFYGSRNTQLYYPAGFEILRAEIPIAGAVADFMRSRLDAGGVVTPSIAEPQNLVPLSYSYLEAALGATDTKSAAKLPHETLSGTKFFPQSGLVASASPHYYAVAAARKGGVIRVFSKHTEQPVYEDAGYVAVRDGAKSISQRLCSASVGYHEANQTISVSGLLSQFRPILPTPQSFLALRLFQMVLGRITVLSRYVRNSIVNRLILAAESEPFEFERAIRFLPDRVEFRDCFKLTKPARSIRLEMVSRLTPYHMGSANYYHSSELHETPFPDTARAAALLVSDRSATVSFAVMIGPLGTELVPLPSATERLETPNEVLAHK